MPVSYTMSLGQTYTLYRGQTKTGKPRYYFGRAGQREAEPVAEMPAGITISESVNGVVSLVKDRPSLIQPQEVAAVEEALKKHPEARRYRIATKHDHIEIYEPIRPDFDALLRELQAAEWWDPGLTSRFQQFEEKYDAQYTPVLRFTLLDPLRRWFGAKRMCYRGSIDGWLSLRQTGPIAELAQELLPTLGTDQFFELW